MLIVSRHVKQYGEALARPLRLRPYHCRVATMSKRTRASSVVSPKSKRQRVSNEAIEVIEVDDNENDSAEITITSRTVTLTTVTDTESALWPVTSSKPNDGRPLVNIIADYGLQWRQHETMYVLDSHSTAKLRLVGSARIASFDMDATLIATKSGKRFPVGRSDWQWLFPEVPAKLRQLYSDGWKLVIFTNQNGISTGQTSATTITGKITDIIADLGVPVQAFIASADDRYRKPSTQMWQQFVANYNDSVSVDLKESVYVGDAAGRAARWDGKADTKKDHSVSDRKFAANVGLKFSTPEPFFLGHAEAKFSMDNDIAKMFSGMIARQSGGGDASAAVTVTETVATVTITDKPVSLAAAVPADLGTTSTLVANHARPHPEMVLMVGFPASGKSTFSIKHFVRHGYAHINRDTYKDMKKCLKAAEQSLSAGQSVVIDNTNPSLEARKSFIDIAKKHKVPVRAYHFLLTEKEANHLNYYREKLTDGAHKHVPRIAYAMFKKQYVTPTMAEGFAEIQSVAFEPEFPSEQAKQLFLHQT